ncbi:MAG: leucine-rich repeat domain-containing protein [Clostridiales bacterium]|nr:leucine-rich repeat domain-containing protein [Clostridiales bacterium]
MKKILVLLTILTISLTSLTACSYNGVSNEPIYETELSFNDRGHYYAQINGSGMKDFQNHVNMLGKCQYCNYYFETDDLGFEIKYDLVDGEPNFYYAVSKYFTTGKGVDCHIQIPLTHKQDAPVYEDEYDENYDPIIVEYANVISNTTYPVLEISAGVFKHTGLESIKLSEGLRTIGNEAFAYTLIKELVIPDSVVGKIAEICVGCSALNKVIIGDGITLMDFYNFTYCSQLRTVKFSKNTTEIRERNFFDCRSLQYLIIPKTVVSIPEAEIWSGGVKKYVCVNNQFQGGNPPVKGIYLEITKEEYDALYLPLLERDEETGLSLDPETRQPIPFEDFQYSTYGFVHGWSANGTLYFNGEWQYDENGEPVPTVEK